MKEEEFLSYVNRFLPENEGLVRSQNEDCVVLREGQAFKLYTTDALVEGVHFKRDYFSPYAIGYKLAAVNLSDIAAMGGKPKWALITLVLSEPPTEAWTEEFYLGLLEGLKPYGARLVGGDTVKGPVFVAVLFVSGWSRNPIFRSGAQPGDLLYVSRPLGASNAALRALLAGTKPSEALLKAHLFPQPEIELGLFLSERKLASAMMDVSDGLLLDLARLCRASGVGAEIEKVPVASGATEEDALSGGEDYALLFTVPPEKEARLLSLTDRPLYRIGRILPEAGKIFLYGQPISPHGFDHFEEA